MGAANRFPANTNTKLCDTEIPSCQLVAPLLLLATGLVEMCKVVVDLVGLWDTEAGICGEGVIPMAAGLVEVARRVVGMGEAVVNASPFESVIGPGGQGERGRVLNAGLVGMSAGLQRLAEIVEGLASPSRSPISRLRVRDCWRWSVACS